MASDPSVKGNAYFCYSMNELGELDIGAQIDHIHVVKCAELGAAGHLLPDDFGSPHIKRRSLDEQRSGAPQRTAQQEDQRVRCTPRGGHELENEVQLCRSLNDTDGSSGSPGGAAVKTGMSRASSTLSIERISISWAGTQRDGKMAHMDPLPSSAAYSSLWNSTVHPALTLFSPPDLPSPFDSFYPNEEMPPLSLTVSPSLPLLLESPKLTISLHRSDLFTDSSWFVPR